MVENTYTKCADIMNGRNNSTFRRNTDRNEETTLKEMKDNTGEKALKKTTTTRKTMLAKSHKFLEKFAL